MSVIAVTRFQLRSLRYLVAFYRSSLRAIDQLCTSPGFREGTFAWDFPAGFWTMTAWDDTASMLAYRNADPHHAIKRDVLTQAASMVSTHWEQDTATLPTRREALRRLQTAGHFSKVNHPSAAHAAQQLPVHMVPLPLRLPGVHRVHPRRSGSPDRISC
jgi:hypothetical protein